MVLIFLAICIFMYELLQCLQAIPAYGVGAVGPWYKTSQKEKIDFWQHVDLWQAKGLGNAVSTSEELKLVKEVAECTGVILGPVYRWLVAPQESSNTFSNSSFTPQISSGNIQNTY